MLGRGSYLSAEMQSVYSVAWDDWATRHLLEGDLTSLQRCSQCILKLQLTGQQDTYWRCGVEWVGYLSAEMQSVYSAALADWATYVRNALVDLKIRSVCFVFFFAFFKHEKTQTYPVNISHFGKILHAWRYSSHHSYKLQVWKFAIVILENQRENKTMKWGNSN